MRLSWNEIRARAAAFANEFSDATYEKGETQSFYDAFFNIFGVKRRSVAMYERHVKKLNNKSGFIDLFMTGVLLVEQKSQGRNLAAAKTQADEYFLSLKEAERPRYILASDFQTFELYDLSERTEISFKLEDLPDHVERFGFIMGVQKVAFKDQDPVNIKAVELIGDLHDKLEEAGFDGTDLERFLVRIVFCLFADDTGVFQPRNLFLDWLEERTSEDGHDLGPKLAELFQTLNKHEDKRGALIDEDLDAFPYVNGDLFSGATEIPAFNSKMRESLLTASRFDWSPISPAIFGSLFQSVMNKEERRKAGAHYTTEKNILKVIGPLFLDDLQAEFERAKGLKRDRAKALDALHDKLSNLTFFDPACGCGNFLIITYREIRRLEIEILKEVGGDNLELDAALLSRVDVDQFHGIEIGEFPAEIARAAMWMMDHIMNNELSRAFGQNYARIPLVKSANIVHGDALEIDWADVIAPAACDYVFGNPPFIGHQWRNEQQQAGMHRVWGRKGQVNRLDYVTCWFRKAVDFAQSNSVMRLAFVATNSITQGEQASILWQPLFDSGVHIFFAHRTFAWGSDARGKAAVHCVIIGLCLGEPETRTIYDYQHVAGEPEQIIAGTINGYLVDAPHILIPARTPAPSGLPAMFKGSQPTDGARIKGIDGRYITRSNLILDERNKEELLKKVPEAEKWLRPFVGGDELISGEWRWCLWLKDALPQELRAHPEIMARLDRVREGRLLSPTKSVREFSEYPSLFTQDRQPTVNYVGVPEVSSEARQYIPIGLLSPDVIASNKLQIVPDANGPIFSLLTSSMHMAWMRAVSGRLESRYSYAPTVYNTFPWPDLTDKAKATLTKTGQAILDARANHPGATLADLYDPDTMPPDLRKAHRANDLAVDKLYRKKPFESERERVEFLFARYEQLRAPLIEAKAKKRRKKSKA